MSEGKVYFTEREKRKVRSTTVQIQHLVDYMAAHTQLATNDFPNGPQSARKHEEEWIKLKTVLREYGPDKSTEQWKHSWRDLKKKARDERKKIKQALIQKRDPRDVPEMSTRSRTILQAIGYESPDEMPIETTLDTSVSCEATWENSNAIIQTVNSKESKESKEEEKRQSTSSDDTMKSPIVEDPLEYEEGGQQGTAEECFEESVACFTEGFQTVPTERYKFQRSSSSMSTTSSARLNKKRKKHNNNNKDKDIMETLNKFIEYEREKEKLQHEREMRRIGQNEKVVLLLEKAVNALESLAPAVKAFMDQNQNHNGDR
ncbi:uncharacterized protein LOC126373341 isoform X1 [Pectinophora gossypiella]|uniref:uncharacterized protein LOC126373341 isoform X1 n=1 Tax=Pectinophora gossypiella TaxID=13191 RepID=UPI00214E426D|nr:uncharacterized protein LOC126373341 isoform X1 [Pectinophora gossypiella]